MVDKKPDFEVKWHGENIRRPPTSGNIRKILCKRGRVQADEKLLTTCILYFKSIRIGQSDDIKCEFVEAAIMRKIIELLDKWWIQCTWEELKKIACALRMLSVRPYSVAEGKPHVDINIVPHWRFNSLMEDIRVSADSNFSMVSSRELLAEMSGRFEELLQYEPRDRLHVPFVTDRELRWIVDTIHQRVITVCTWTGIDSPFSEFEEYCYRLENFRIRQPSTEQYLQPSSERARTPSSERTTTQSRQQPNFGVMVDKKPDFRVKWHGENIRRPYLSGNTRKIRCKDEVVDIDENYIRKCMIYFSEIPSEQSDVPLECEFIEAAILKKIIELLENGEFQCTWEELKKIAFVLKVLTVHPYNVPEAKLHVEIYIVPHWCVTSRPNDITVSVGKLAVISNRQLLAEMSGRFEELLQYECSDTLQVPFVTFNDLSWIVNTIHQREVTVNTWKDLLWSEFEEYCYRLENFRIRQPSSERTRTSSERTRTSSERTRTSSEQSRSSSSEQSRPPSSGRTRTSSEHSRQPHKEQHGQPSSEGTRTSSCEQSILPHREQYGQPSSERFRQPSSEQSRPPYREQSRPPYREQSRPPYREQYAQPPSGRTRTSSGEQSILPHREQYGQPSSERTRSSSEQSRPPSSGRTRTSSEQSRQPHKEQHRQPSSEGTRTSSGEQFILPHREQYGQLSSERTRTSSSERFRQPSSEQSRPPYREQYAQPSSERTRTSSEQSRASHREQYGKPSSEQSRPPYREQYGQPSSEQTITPYREQYGEPSSDRFKQPYREQSSPHSRQQITKNDTPEQFPTTSTVEVLPIAGPSWKYETSTRCESSNSAGYFSEGIGLTENVTSPESGVLPVAGRSQTAGTVGTAHRTLEVPQDYQIKLVPLQEAFHRLRPGGHVLCLTEQEAMALLNSEGRVRIEYLGASASIDLDQQETSLPLVDECSTKAGTQDKSERSSVKEELLAKSADQSRKSAGSSPKSVPRKQKSKKNGSYADEDFSKETSGVAQETSPKEFLTSAFTQPSTSRETTDLLTVPRPTLQGEISGVEEHEIRKFIVPRKQKSKKHGSYADENFSKETSGVAQETLHKEFPTSAILQPSTSRGTGVLLKVPSPVPLAELFDDDEYEIREVDVTKNDTREQFPKTRTVEVLPKAGPSLSECIGFSEDFTSQESCVLPVGGSLQTAGTVGTAHRTLEVPQNYQIIVDPPPEAFHHLRPGDHVVRLTEEEAMALLNPEGRVRIEFLGVSKTIYLDQQEMTLHLVDECSTEAGTQKKAEPSSAKEDLSAKSADQSRKSAGSSPKSPGPSPKGASPFPKND